MNQGLLLGLSIVLLLGFFALLTVSKGSTSARKSKLLELKNKMYELKHIDKELSDLEKRDMLVQMDSVFSKAMNIKLYNNLSFADNIKQLADKFDKDLYNDIWQAHKKRNRVVHESEYVTESELKIYSNAFYKGINKI